MTKEIAVLDHGFVRLDDSMADDLSVVNSARVSLNNRSDWEYTGEARWLSAKDVGLINFLMSGRHGTPFEHNAFRFHVKLPIFVAREWMRHRIGSFNEQSGRYMKLEAEFYIPESENVRTQVGKPGAYSFNVIEEQRAGEFAHVLSIAQRDAFQCYENALEAGVAKELARLFLPVSIYTQFYWTINARSLMNFLSLRNSEFAQFEIRQYAEVVENIFAATMPVTHEAFLNNGRVAP